jgi:hypothetical protein
MIWEKLTQMVTYINRDEEENFIKFVTENIEDINDDQGVSAVLEGVTLTKEWIEKNIEFCSMLAKHFDKDPSFIDNLGLRTTIRLGIFLSFVEEIEKHQNA